MSLEARALQAIDRYRHSHLHDEIAGCCRFTPSCSHYAEDALRHRALPMALLLVAWRILRCNRFTAVGTYDPVGPRVRARRVAAVLGLAAITTLFVGATAAAAATPPMQNGGSSQTDGGCDAFVGGVPIGTISNREHPLQIHTGQHIVLTGFSPLNIRNLPATLELRSDTEIDIHFVEKLATTVLHESATGARFQRSVNVDTYLKYGSGLYRVDVRSVARPGWDCSGTFWVDLHGSKLAAEVAVAVGGIGAVGVALSPGDEPPPFEPPARPDDQGTYDPGIAPDKLEAAQAAKAKAANAKATSTVGCLAAILFALIASTGAFALAAPAATAKPKPNVVWTRGHPILGFVSGLFFGLGTTVALQQLSVYPLTLTSAVIAPLVTAALGAWRGWRGCAWKVG